jgi:putative membrane-bound dehydrogenase-like protein
MPRSIAFAFALAFAAAVAGAADHEPSAAVLPSGPDGRPLNFDFETGTLDDWVASGTAFQKQPIEGDVVHARRPDMRSDHRGRFWVGTYEVAGDEPQGTLTSVPFKVTHPWASLMVGGGSSPKTRVELLRMEDRQIIFQTSGDNSEDLKYAVVDLRPHRDQTICIRLVDESSAGWGHINFDDFRFHDNKPDFPHERLVPPPDEFLHAGLSPSEAARAMTLPPGFRATLFAGEPDVQQPIAAAIDDRGRLWVAEAYSYPHRVKEDDARDRILIFEDRDGDGRFDERKIFVERLNLVSGLEIGFGGVWVGAAPHLLFIPDRDRDDRPDGPPEVLLDGWGYQDTHETLNAFIWGPDGWLYGCHGVFTHSLVGKPGASKKERTPLNAAIWRYHPTRHVFEVVAHGTSNPWGVDFDDNGEAFCTACVIPHLFHIIPGGRYHRQAGSHFNRHTYDDIQTIADHVHWVGAQPHGGNNKSDTAGGGHAHSGAMIYQGGAWPEEYRGQIFMNNIHGARINVDALEPQGSGYVGHHRPDFLLSNDRWSQILNLYYGPDGQVYIIDWYDENQCHRIERDVHDRSNGRIFKIAYGDRPSLPVDLTALSDAQLIDLLLHKNEWFVRHARRLLQERAAQRPVSDTCRQQLIEMALTDHDPSRRLRGLWALHGVGALDDSLIDRGLENDQAFVRAWTIRLAAEEPDRMERILPKLIQLAASDSSPVVRKYLASAMQRLDRAMRWDVLAALTAHGDDATDHNLPLLYWYALEPLADLDASRFLTLANQSSLPLLATFAARRLSTDGDRQRLALLVEELGNSQNPAQQIALLEGINTGLRGRRRVSAPDNWPNTSPSLLNSSDERVRMLSRTLAVTLGDPAAFAELRATVLDAAASLGSRRAALAALLDARDEELPPTLLALLNDASLRREAIRGLALYDAPQAAEALVSRYASLDLQERRDALTTLASRPAYAAALLDALAAKTIATSDVSADLIRLLRGHKNETLNRRIQQVWGEVRDTGQEIAARIEKYRSMLKGKPKEAPNLALGRAVFAKTCQQCHVLFGVGGNVGPELTGSNRADLEYVLSNVLDPSALIAKDYLATVVATTDGRVLTGIVRGEDGERITLVTANETIVLPRSEIDEIQPSTQSMMPDDIFQPLSEHEVRSLVAYLASPAQTPMLATPENCKGFFNATDLSGWSGNTSLWSVENGEIVGRSPGLDHNEFLVSDLLAEDFRLRFQVKLIGQEANSGVQFRSQPLQGGDVQGYQADIGQGWWGKLYEEHGRGLLWDRSGDPYVRTEDWNDYEVVVLGSRIRTFINGNLCVDLDDPAGAQRGIFALQIHSGPAMEVRFRNFQLEVNPDGGAVASAAGK